MADGKSDYEVGYGKPPKHSRFPPGQSGNPKGKQKGKKGLKTDLADELDARQTIQINGKPVTGRRQQLVVMALAARAAAGDLKAARTLLPLIVQVLGTEDRGIERRRLSPQDQAILDDMLGELGQPEAEAGAGGQDDGSARATLTSRLNDKASGAIITVMQRLHEHDLAGMLLETPGWRELRLSAIAAEDEIIALPRGKMHYRKAGDILHPERENLAVLDAQKLAMGSLAFEAQYQQNPLPAVGNMVRAEWLRTYTDADLAARPGHIMQSWDTASKDGVHNDWSVCITANVYRAEVRILDVFRKKLTFPDLKRHAIRLAEEYRPQRLLIEDAASGQQLLQVLRNDQPRGVPLPIPRRPELDKVSRMAGASGQIEGGQLLLPQDAPWLPEFKAELLGFPNARFDDQADALTQLLNWVLRQHGTSGLSALEVGPTMPCRSQSAWPCRRTGATAAASPSL